MLLLLFLLLVSGIFRIPAFTPVRLFINSTIFFNLFNHTSAKSGLPADLIDVVPHAINDSMWSPRNKPYHFPTKKKFTFLFVSGMLHRKGIDVLLEAYTTAFTANDDVSL